MFGASERRQSRRRRRFGRACATLFERILTICRNFLRRASLWALRFFGGRKLRRLTVYWATLADWFARGRSRCLAVFALAEAATFGGFALSTVAPPSPLRLRLGDVI